MVESRRGGEVVGPGVGEEREGYGGEREGVMWKVGKGVVERSVMEHYYHI